MAARKSDLWLWIAALICTGGLGGVIHLAWDERNPGVWFLLVAVTVSAMVCLAHIKLNRMQPQRVRVLRNQAVTRRRRPCPNI